MIQPINSLSFKAIYKQPGGRFTEKEFELINDVQEKMNTTKFKETKNNKFIDYLDTKNYHLFIKPGTFENTIDISLSEGVSFTPEGIKLYNEKEVGTFDERKEFLPEYVKGVYDREQTHKSFNLMGMLGIVILAATIILGGITAIRKDLIVAKEKEIVTDTLKTLQKDTLDLSQKFLK